MINTTIGQIADMCGGQLNGDPSVLCHGVIIDSRQLHDNCLFIPIIGERMDGHDLVGQVLADGAAAALWQADHGAPPTGNTIVVENTLEALQQLASAYLDSTEAQVIGITGSNGKTTTKDMIYALMTEAYRVHKTEGNFNSHIGLPLTILAMPRDTQILILEMGMRARGEIELLSHIARPDTAVITNIGESHLEQLGSREEIARAKLEIVNGLKPSGLLVYHGDEPLLKQVLAEPQYVSQEMRKVTFGMEHNNDLYATGMMTQEQSTIFTTNALSEEAWNLPVLGAHNMVNAMAAILVANAYGLSEAQIRQGFAKLRLTGMRIEMLQGRDGITLLNDAYNASPSSMKAAIDVLGSLKGYKRKIAVLGDMLELGTEELAYHEQIGEYVDGQADLLLTYGERGKAIASGAARHLPPEAIRSYTSKPELIDDLLQTARSKDVILFKASRGMRLEEVIQALMPDSISNA
ncbi:UDP-N-acetylmuramoyl-tripeptide--D-alanyl-D-alanine ligase [Paenibacillus sp. Z6-24]